MRVAVIGSRTLEIENLADFLPPETSEIVSGGARGIDRCARRHAFQNGIKLKEFLPDYQQFGRKAPLHRNIEIICYADLVLAFWDGKSPGTRFVIEQCRKRNRAVRVFKVKEKEGK